MQETKADPKNMSLKEAYALEMWGSSLNWTNWKTNARRILDCCALKNVFQLVYVSNGWKKHQNLVSFPKPSGSVPFSSYSVENSAMKYEAMAIKKQAWIGELLSTVSSKSWHNHSGNLPINDILFPKSKNCLRYWTRKLSLRHYCLKHQKTARVVMLPMEATRSLYTMRITKT